MQDLVSIIMPSYNTARYIADSIRSVQAQTYGNWELLIVDDCSTDDTDGAVAPFLADGRIRYLKNAVNSGAAVSRNYALREAKGRWIAFLDSDDLWFPEKLERQLAFMEETGCHFSYTCYRQIDEQSRPLGVTVRGPRHITKAGMVRFCWPGCLTVMYDAQEVGLLQIPDIRKNNDYAMWLRVIEKADCCLLPEILASYRRRTGSISNQSYSRLIKWHYRLFRQVQGESGFRSAVHTAGNLVFGVYKKLRYVEHSSEDKKRMEEQL